MGIFRGALKRDATLLEDATDHFRNALEIFTRDKLPSNWAETQEYLARNLSALGQLQKDMAKLEEARAAILGAVELAPENQSYKATLEKIQREIEDLKGAVRALSEAT